VYYHNPAIQLLLHNFPTKSLTRAGKQLPFKTQSKLHLTLHQKLSIVSMYPVFQRRGKFSFCLIITARFGVLKECFGIKEPPVLSAPPQKKKEKDEIKEPVVVLQQRVVTQRGLAVIKSSYLVSSKNLRTIG